MLFSSPAFFLFFAVYLGLNAVIPTRFRLALVIIGSTIFYAYWNPAYVWIPYFLMLVAYFGVLWTMAEAEAATRKRRLTLIIALLLLPLLIVKYTNFIYKDVLGLLTGADQNVVNWALPLGISFMTFTLIAYAVDVYKGHFQVERNPAMLAGLVLFFPHLIAGPILRPHELLPQLLRRPRHSEVRFVFGLAIFTVGLVKKLIFADPLAEHVDKVYASDPGMLSSLDYLLGIYGFSAQIYCDFSGYTDMALASAILLGVKLPNNFDRPYVASSIVEFWTRWHITLSKWLRDYLYFSLGGNREGFRKQVVNLFLTMGLGGLWHGANWTFVVWGLLHGSSIAATHGLRRSKFFVRMVKLPKWLMVLLTFHLVTLCWIPFRAPNIETAQRVLLGPFLAPMVHLREFLSTNAFLLALLGVFLVLHQWDSHRMIRRAAARTPKALFWPVVMLGWVLALTVSQGSSAKFIYFDF